MLLKPKIFIIEDAKSYFGICCKQLFPDDNFDVNIFNYEPKLVGLLEKKEFDVILMNIAENIGDEIKLLEQLKGNQKIQNIPIVVVLTKYGHENIKKYLNAGAHDCLVKPVNMLDLKNKILLAINY